MTDLPFASIEYPFEATFCKATVRNGPRAGQPCGRISLENLDVCLKHGAHLPEVQKRAQAMAVAARVEMAGHASDAIETIFRLAENAASESVMLKAATELLDRIGVRGGTELAVKAEITDSRSVDLIADRLNKLSAASQRTSFGTADPDEEEDEDGQLVLPLPAEPEEEDAVEGEIVFPRGYTPRRTAADQLRSILPSHTED